MSESVKLPSAWASAPLSNVSDINPRSFCSVPSAAGKPVHFVPMSAVTEEFGGIDVSTRRPLGDVQKGYTSFLANDVLLAKITPCMENGKLAVVPPLPDHLAFGSTEFHVLRATDQVQPSWLAYFLSQSSFRRLARQNMTGSAGQLRVATTWLADALIPVAPAAEQTRIVAKLEELLSDLDAGVAELKAAQKKLGQYRQSLLKAAVEGALTAEWRANNTPSETGAQLLDRILQERRARWEAKQLAKFAEQSKTPPKDWQKKYPEPVQPDITGLPELPEGWVWASVDQLVAESSYGTSGKCNYESDGTPVLRIPNVSGGRLDLRDIKFSITDLNLGKDDYLAIGDVLVIRTNGSIGLVGRAAAVVNELHQPHYFASYLLRLRCTEKTSGHRWLLSVLSAYTGRQWLEARAASSAGQHNISLSTLLTMPIPLAPLAEQICVLGSVEEGQESIKQQEEAIGVSLKQSTAQRQNILRAAFAGQLVPQDPNDEPAGVLLARIRAERVAQSAVKKPRGRRVKESV